MKKVQYKAKSGKTQWKPVFDRNFERACYEEGIGFCLACGSTQSFVEPDGRRYTCEDCRQPKVYGLEELLLMGLVDTKEEAGQPRTTGNKENNHVRQKRSRPT